MFLCNPWHGEASEEILINQPSRIIEGIYTEILEEMSGESTAEIPQTNPWKSFWNKPWHVMYDQAVYKN